MKSTVKLLLIISSIIAMLFSSCTNTNGNSGTSNTDTDSNVKHYEIELNKDNFRDYCDYKVTIPEYATAALQGDFYEIKGVLSYAYYKDVFITFYAEFSNSDGLGGTIVYKGNYTIKLNAAGCYSFYTYDEALLEAIKCDNYNRQTKRKPLTIVAVSGTVIFDI